MKVVNSMHKKALRLTVLAALVVLLALSAGLYFLNQQSPLDRLKNTFFVGVEGDIDDFVYHHEIIEDNIHLFFYRDRFGEKGCAVIKEGIFSSTVLDNGALIPSTDIDGTNYLFSAFRKGREYDRWIQWGIITDETIRTVKINENNANIHHINRPDEVFRLFWVVGKGVMYTTPSFEIIR